MNNEEITKWWADKATTEFGEVFSRMDEDYIVWDMRWETQESSIIGAQTQQHGSDIRIKSNDLRTNADNVQSILASSDMQIMVRMAEAEGEDKREDMGKLERLLYFSLARMDERLARLILPPLRISEIWLGMIRGAMAGRFMVYKHGKNVVFDGVPFDPRWMVYEIGDEGLLKVGHKTFRTKSSLEGYKKDVKYEERNNEVIDYWENVGKTKDGLLKIKNSIVYKDTTLHEQTYKLRSMPVLISPVSTRPPIAGMTGLETRGYGDSIFAPARQINAVRDRFVSIVANHANLMANQALINYKDSQGVDVKTTTNIPGGVINLPKDHNKLEPSPMRDISPTVVSMLDWLNGQLYQVMLPRIPVGSPPPSGTLYNLAQEAGNKIFNPQLRTLSSFHGDICRLTEEQLIDEGIKVKIQGIEKNKYYETQVTPVDLKRPHTIKVDFTARTPWTQLDTAQTAQMLKQLGLPDGWIWENILKVQDPKGLADLAAIELFEHSPKGAMKRAVEALIETRGDVDAAMSLVEDMDRLEAQENMAVEEAPIPAPPQAGV